jgi:hypothetical protein
MATIIAQPMPRVGRRMLVAAAVGVLLGGFAGGLVGRAIESRGDVAGTTRPVSESVFSPEAIRAYVGSTSTAAFSPEAIRAKNHVLQAPSEALRPEALRMRAGSSHAEAFSPEAARLEN